MERELSEMLIDLTHKELARLREVLNFYIVTMIDRHSGILPDSEIEMLLCDYGKLRDKIRTKVKERQF